MKNISFISVLFSITAFAGNDISESSIPQNVSQKFHDQFPEARSVAWHLTDKNQYEAVVIGNDSETDVYYDTQARCVEVDRKITFEHLPVDLQAQIKNEYGVDFYIVHVVIVDKQNAKPVYAIRIKQGKLAYELELVDTNKADWAFHKRIIS
jgi:hypothetical protein